jgi:hypothetical protein
LNKTEEKRMRAALETLARLTEDDATPYPVLHARALLALGRKPDLSSVMGAALANILRGSSTHDNIEPYRHARLHQLAIEGLGRGGK